MSSFLPSCIVYSKRRSNGDKKSYLNSNRRCFGRLWSSLDSLMMLMCQAGLVGAGRLMLAADAVQEARLGNPALKMCDFFMKLFRLIWPLQGHDVICLGSFSKCHILQTTSVSFFILIPRISWEIWLNTILMSKKIMTSDKKPFIFHYIAKYIVQLIK